MFTNSVFLGVMITLGSYGIGMMLKRKTGWALMNPLLVAIVLVIAFLLLTGVSYKDYAVGSNCISYMLTPSTICLAVPLYQQMELLKKNYRAVLAGIVAGVLSSLVTILVLALLFHSTRLVCHLLPKSITTAIGMGVSEELGGYVS